MYYEIRGFNPSEEWPEGLNELLTMTQDEAVQMLPLTEEDVMNHECQTGAFNEAGKLIGYMAITFGSTGEVGALVVGEAYRQQGVGHGLVGAVTASAMAKSIQPIAFCNPLSAPLFEAAGYEPLSAECIPSEALELCDDCRKKPEDGGCCDTVYAFASEVEVEL